MGRDGTDRTDDVTGAGALAHGGGGGGGGGGGLTAVSIDIAGAGPVTGLESVGRFQQFLNIPCKEGPRHAGWLPGTRTSNGSNLLALALAPPP